MPTRASRRVASYHRTIPMVLAVLFGYDAVSDSSEAVKRSALAGETACATETSAVLSQVGQTVSSVAPACGRRVLVYPGHDREGNLVKDLASGSPDSRSPRVAAGWG